VREAVSAKEEYAVPNTKDFREHRYDQSILTNLKIKHNLYSSGDIRQFVTCNVPLVEIEKINPDVTFVVPLFYDGRERIDNVNALLRYIKRFRSKVIVGEQLDHRFNYLSVYKYMYFGYKQFHRTKMINEMVMQSDTDIIVVCDADVIIPEEQYYEAVRMISEDGVDVVYPFSSFVKLDKTTSEFLRKNQDTKQINCVPGERS